MARKLAFVATGAMPDKQLVWKLYISGTLLALAAQVILRPLAGRDTDPDELMRVRQNPKTWEELLVGPLRMRAGGPANLAESFNLLVQSVTVGLGGLFLFGAVDEPATPWTDKRRLGLVVGVFVVVINFLTLIPALRLVYGMLKQRCCAADEATAPLLGPQSQPEPEPEPEPGGSE